MDTKPKIKLDHDTISRQAGTCEHGCAWIEYEIDPYTRDCDCDGDDYGNIAERLCDPEACPRFTDDCARCDKTFTGGGWLCLDGGEAYCTDCVETVEA